MNSYDESVIEKLKTGHRIGPHTKKKTSIPIEKLYCLAKGISSIPKCLACGTEVKLKSISAGFKKYCSKECHCSDLSRKNSEKNRNGFNKKIGAEKRKRTREEQKERLEVAINEYLEGNESIKELSERHSVTVSHLREMIQDRVPEDQIKTSQYNSWYRHLQDKLGKQYELLEDSQWLREQRQTYTCKEVARQIGCSANLVAYKARDLGIPFTRKPQSSYERKIVSFLSELGIENIITNTRSIIHGKELDIFLPDHNLAIEVNGVYWHKHISGVSDKNRHKIKTDLCKENGIDLIQVFDYELDDGIIFNKLKSIIELKLGLVQQNIYARNCTVKEIDSVEYKTFLSENHIKGSISSKIKLGLYSDKELCMVMGFSKPRFNKNYEWELIRLCSKRGVKIAGGASKLFAKFIKNHEPSSVISYCDNRFFNGNVYSVLGFIKYNDGLPNYMWVDKLGHTLSRYNTQKHKIADNKTEELTETQIMESRGYMKIYDCGQSVYVWQSIRDKVYA